MGTHKTTSHARLDVLTVNYDTSSKSIHEVFTYVCVTHTSLYLYAFLYVLHNFTCDNFFGLENVMPKV